MKLHIPHVDIVKYRGWWFGISLALTIPGIIAVIVAMIQFGAPVKLGIDFTGGSLMQYQFEKPVALEDIRHVLEETGFHGSQVQEAQISGKTVIVMRTKALPDDKQDEMQKRKLDSTLEQKFGQFHLLSRDKVSGVVGPELLTTGVLALFITLGAMIVYIGSRFQYDFAMCAIVALVHDVVVLVGIFALLGLVIGTEVDSLFISALLTVIGFSVHDTIVVFDRIRENMKYVGSRQVDPSTGKDTRKTFGDVANDSVNQTLARSIYTSLTVAITLTALFLWGGTTTRDFVLAMLIGVVSGTYSSIFNASALLAWWREKKPPKAGKPAAASATA
jgi:preprotein translocase subunit SecF